MLTKLYRYEEVRYAPMLDGREYVVVRARIEVELYEFKVIRVTKCGAWIYDRVGRERFVNLEARKQYACKTAVEARIAFIARKKRQHQILTAQLKDVEKSLELVSAPIIKR